MSHKFYVDEDVAKRTVPALCSAGFDAVYARDLSHQGWDDPNHLVYAVENGYTVVTANKNDFSLLHRLWALLVEKNHASISHLGIITAKGQLQPPTWVTFINQLISSGESLDGSLFVWDSHTLTWEKL